MSMRRIDLVIRLGGASVLVAALAVAALSSRAPAPRSPDHDDPASGICHISPGHPAWASFDADAWLVHRAHARDHVARPAACLALAD
jgi:hypothetical protein